MDGILDELLRLEDAKHHALIGLDPAEYDRSVQAQTALIEDSRLPEEAKAGREKLLAISKLATVNTTLYRNLFNDAPWLVPAGGYTDSGMMSAAPAARTFSAEA